MMRPIQFHLALCLIAFGWVAADEPTSETVEPNPLAILTPVDLVTEPAWRDFLDQLGTPVSRFSTFTEFRHFPFRRTPVKLSGEIRIEPDLGFSLRYLEPKEQLLIVDTNGVLMRDAKGREREAPANSRATQVADTLIHVFNFDPTALAADFDLRGARDGEAWRLELTSRDPDELGPASMIFIEGSANVLSSIELRASARQRVVIRIGHTREDVTFTNEEVDRFFR